MTTSFAGENIGDTFDQSMPDITKHPNQWTREDYIQAVRHFSTYHNNSTYQNKYGFSENEIIERSFDFFFGMQENLDYAYIATDYVSNAQDALGIQPGQKAYQLIELMRGQFLRLIDRMRLRTESISKEAKTQQFDMYRKAHLKYLLRDEFDEIAKMGVEFNPAGPDFNPQFSEDAAEAIETTFLEEFRITSRDLGYAILEENQYKDRFLRLITNVLIAGRYGTDCIMEGARMKWVDIPPHCLIIDKAIDCDYNSKARFGGYVEYKSITEALATPGWTWTKTQIEMMKALARGDSWGDAQLTADSFNTQAGFKWWRRNGTGVHDIAVVRMYFKKADDLKRQKKFDSEGRVRMKKLDNVEKLSPYAYESWHQAVLVGNLILQEEGRVPNQISLLNDYIENDLPLKIWMPGMFKGFNRSPLNRIESLQEKIDAFKRVITDKVATAWGKGVIIDGSVYGITESTQIVADLKRDGITVINGATGDRDDDDKARNGIYGVDKTGDPIIKTYIDLLKEDERTMEEILSIPKIAQGQQQGYVGQGVQQTTLERSGLGMESMVFGFQEYINRLTRYSVNVARYGMTADGNEYVARMKLGDKGYQFAKITRELRLQDVNTYFTIDDVIDDKQWARILGYAQAFMQNSGGDPDVMLDVLRMEQCKTIDEMIVLLRVSLKKKKQEMKMQQLYADMVDKLNTEKAAATQLETARMNADTSRANKQDEVVGKVLPALLGGPK